jgi:hypothetical protein
MKNVLFRVADLLTMAMLVWGTADMQTFAAAVAWFFFVLCLFGIFAMNEKTAKALQDAPTWKVAIAVGFHFGYVGALLASGRPILAACYLLAELVLRIVASDKLKEGKVSA